MDLLTLALMIPLTWASPNPAVLEYALSAIEYEASIHYGTFSCVFYDIGPTNSYRNILNDLLKSPRLDHVVRYVVGGGSDLQSELEKLPMSPPLLILHPGHDGAYLKRVEVRKRIYEVLKLFNPTTNVFVFVDFDKVELFNGIRVMIGKVKFTYSVFMDSKGRVSRQCNGKWCWDWEEFPTLPSLFNYGRRWMKGRPITYIRIEDKVAVDWNLRWTWEVARYLNTEAIPCPQGCTGSGQNFSKCMEGHRRSIGLADISFDYLAINIDKPRRFGQLFTSLPRFIKVAVPKDRPLNTVEIILMPFSIPVWILLTVILLLLEFIKYLFPNLLKNDPILLVVCGFERHNLHQAGRLEKTTLLSLIILIFFLSNAFETKITSLMISKPSMQRIKTLEDFFKSNLKIHANLELHPTLADDPIFGKKVTQGDIPSIGEVIPNVAMLWNSEWVETFNDLFYDFNRMQPSYVALNEDILDGYELYGTSTRFLFLEDFRKFHLWLVEAGLIKLWKRLYSDEIRAFSIGRKSLVDIRDKVHLTFEDMQIAWLVLASGLGMALGGFAVERGVNLFELKKEIVVENSKKLWKNLKYNATIRCNYPPLKTFKTVTQRFLLTKNEKTHF